MGKGMVIAGLMLWAGASTAGSTQANYFELHFVQSEFGGAGDGRTSNGGLGFSFAKSFWEHAAWAPGRATPSRPWVGCPCNWR